MRGRTGKNSPFALIWLLSFFSYGVAGAQQFEPLHTSREFLLGGDISALTKIEDYHGTYRDNDKVQDCIEILTQNGCNCARLRLFVDPNHENLVVNDLAYTLALAKRCRNAGQLLLLDFHYSDTWADPGKQFTPAEWSALTFDELELQVKEYTAEVIAQFNKEGALPDIVQIGNEVVNGMLWPHGKIKYDGGSAEEQKSWARFARLLKAGIAGVKSGLKPSQQIKIMIHIDRGADWSRTRYFFDHLEQEKVDFDMIGQSYYPWWHGSLQELKKNLEQTANRYQKQIVIVETGYPHRGLTWKDRPNMAWPISPAGQAQFLQDVVQAILQTPHGLGAGVLYWYPEAIPVVGLQIWEGGSVGLFDEAGNTLPALKLFSKGVPITSTLKVGEKR